MANGHRGIKMADETQSKAVVVDLEQVHGGRAFAREHSFFQRELDQALEIVLRLGERAAMAKANASNGKMSESKENEILHSHDCISVLGRRGVGKTSFILSLGKLVEKTCSAESPKETRATIKVLTPIDPTMMEDTDTFLSLVIANVLHHVESKLNGKSWPEELDQSLTDLSSKVGVLAPASVHESLWKDILLDSENYTFEILRKARSGIGLGKSVNSFLLTCAKICGVDAFMQAIDDVDTAVQRGWPVLETLRKYLSSPYLITVLTGDSQLFDVMVSQQKFNSLDATVKLETYIKIPNNAGKITVSMVDHLVDQYLMKVMPPHQRIMLPIVAEEIIEASFRNHELIRVKSRKNADNPKETEDDFSELFRLLTKEILHFPNSLNSSAIRSLDCLKPEVGDYLSILIPRFTRSLIQFMEMLSANKLTLNQPAMERDLLFEQLMHVFQITLSRRGILYRDMERLWHCNHIEWFTKFCLDVRQEAPRIWSLDSNYDDVGWSQRTLLLQAALLQGWKRCSFSGSEFEGADYRLLNPAGPMSYIIKTCLPCWIADEQQLVADNIAGLKNLMRIGISNGHGETASLSLAYLLRDEEWPVHGVMYLLPPIHWGQDLAECHLHDLSVSIAGGSGKVIGGASDTANPIDQDQGGLIRDNLWRFATHGFLPWWGFLKAKAGNIDLDGVERWSLYLPDIGVFNKIAGSNARFLLRWFGFYRYRPAQGNMRYYAAPVIGFARIVDIVSAFPHSEEYSEKKDGSRSLVDSEHDVALISEMVSYIQELIFIRPHEVTPSEPGKTKDVSSASTKNNQPKGHKKGAGSSDGSTDLGSVETDIAGNHVDRHEYGDNDDAIGIWAKSMISWRNSLSQLRPGEVLPPRVMSRVFVRMIEQLKVMNSSLNYPKSSWSVGQFLEQWVCCFMNALIVEELTHQVFWLKDYADIKLDYDVAIRGVGAVYKNLQVLKECGEIGKFSRKWLGCPLLMAVVRKELRTEFSDVSKTKWDEDLFQTRVSFGLNSSACGELRESEKGGAEFVDAYLLLCSVMYQSAAKHGNGGDKSGWRKVAEMLGYPVRPIKKG